MNRAPMRFSVPQETNKVYELDEKSFGDWQKQDSMPQSSFDAEASFRYQQRGVKKSRSPFCGSLPFATTPKVHKNPDFRMVPVSTRSSTIHSDFNAMAEARGPLYLQQWPIWDGLAHRPSRGDVTLDPRYATQTKGSLTTYMRLQ